MTEPIDVEHETMAVAIRPAQEVGLFGAAGPVEVIAKATAIANALKGVIVSQGLVSTISGKLYPKCEAWTLLGTMLGVFPVTVWTKPVEGGWEARVEARTKDGAIIGAAEAQCLRGEKNWSNRDDFALRSMAQTRATAKCLRMPLGFVMTLSGFEATPSEEMDFERAKPAAAAQSPKPEPKPAAPRPATAATLKWMREQLHAEAGGDAEGIVTEFFRAVNALLPSENLGDLKTCWVPVNKRMLEDLAKSIADFENGDPALMPYAVEQLPEPQPKAPKAEPAAKDDEPWRNFPMPFGKHAGVLLGDLDRKYLYGLAMNYKVETEYKGVPRTEGKIAADTKFREMLDACKQHYGFEKKDNLGSE